MGKLVPSHFKESQIDAKSQFTHVNALAQQFLNKDTPRNQQIAVANNIIGVNLAMIGRPKPDLASYEECADALAYYFKLNSEHDVKPTISGIAMALGLSRQNFLRACDTGEVENIYTRATIILPQAVRELFVDARQNYIGMMEGFMESGSLHPACGIFMLKNNAGYKEVVEQHHTVTKTIVDSETLAEKYRDELKGLD